MIFNKFPHEYQMDAKDCGPACLKIIAKYYGKYYGKYGKYGKYGHED